MNETVVSSTSGVTGICGSSEPSSEEQPEISKAHSPAIPHKNGVVFI
jgi:hypothetical protein